MAIKAILWDIDNTLLDFLKAEREALGEAFRTHGLRRPTAEETERYSRINISWWERLERGEITRPQVMLGRFRDFFAALGLPPELAEPVARDYEHCLHHYAFYLPGAEALVRRLRGRWGQYVATNGTASVQHSKLGLCGLDRLLDGLFISEELGAEKPSAAFFDAVLAALPGLEPRELLMVGDSLTSDMRGAVNYGIHSCWFNPKGKAMTLETPPEFEIRRLEEVEDILSLPSFA